VTEYKINDSWLTDLSHIIRILKSEQEDKWLVVVW